MYGIFGVKSNDSIDKSNFNRALNLLAHRGPDLSQSYFDNEVAIGFKRLSIQDLTHAGDQPQCCSKIEQPLIYI